MVGDARQEAAVPKRHDATFFPASRCDNRQQCLPLPTGDDGKRIRPENADRPRHAGAVDLVDVVSQREAIVDVVRCGERGKEWESDREKNEEAEGHAGMLALKTRLL